MESVEKLAACGKSFDATMRPCPPRARLAVMTLLRAQHAAGHRLPVLRPGFLLSVVRRQGFPHLSCSVSHQVSPPTLPKCLAQRTGLVIAPRLALVSRANPASIRKALPYTWLATPCLISKGLLMWLVRPGDSTAQKVGGMLQVEFLADPVTIRFNGFNPDVQLLGYLTSVKAPTCELKHLQFAVSE